MRRSSWVRPLNATGWAAPSTATRWISFPDLPGRFHHPLELAPLLVLRELVAVVGAREPALRRQAQIFKGDVLRSFLDFSLEGILVLQDPRFRGDQSQHHLLALRQEAQRREAAGALGVELHEEAVDVRAEHRLGDRLVAALGHPGALEVAAAGV